jgi:translation initiation factor eIF-2B subunit epsilon
MALADFRQCLLPLANTPLIEYTLEFLAMAGVEDIYIYCGAHTSAVEEYLNASKWNPSASPASPFSTLEILRSPARSVGDALRDIDNRGLITGDFLLVNGDLVSNLPIDAALAAHRERRIADKNAIMTMILREGGLGAHRTKAHGITPVFVVDPIKNRCLHYEEISPLKANKYINIDPELLSEHSEIEVREDLIDCGIDICTPDVLALWSESFDYEVPRRHFLHGVLKDYELNGKTIHTEFITSHYAARVNNLRAYDAVSKDVLGRWTYPLVPDSNLLAGQSYKYSRGGICKEDGVILARSCKVGKKTVLGKNTNVGDASIVSNSIIGRNCVIGKNVTIENAYIWDGVTISDGAEIRRAILASDAVIGQNCHIEPGALISFGVVISDNTTVKERARITCAKRKRADVDGEPLSRVLADHSTVGSSGEGYLYSDSDSESDDEQILQSTLIYSTAHLNLSNESISTVSSSVSGDSPSGPRSRLSSFAGSISSDDGISNAAGGGGSGESFHKDAVADIFKTLSEAGNFHNTRVEFTSLRLSNNATDHHVHRAIAVGFTKHISQLVESGLEPGKAVAATLGREGAVAFLADVAIGREKKMEDQVDFLVCIQKDLVHRVKGDAVLFSLVKELYDREVVEEEGMEAWWADTRSVETDEIIAVRGKTEAFMVWLREAEEEESDEESGDDDDSE